MTSSQVCTIQSPSYKTPSSFRWQEGGWRGAYAPPRQKAGEIPIRIPLPIKDQRSANKLPEHLSDLSREINTGVHPDFTSRKIKDELKAKEPKPPIVNQQNVVYFFKCDLCDADYIGFSSRHLHQRVEEHKRLVIGNHVKEQHGDEPCEIAKNFRVLRKCWCCLWAEGPTMQSLPGKPEATARSSFAPLGMTA